VRSFYEAGDYTELQNPALVVRLSGQNRGVSAPTLTVDAVSHSGPFTIQMSLRGDVAVTGPDFCSGLDVLYRVVTGIVQKLHDLSDVAPLPRKSFAVYFDE
jgi:hypothetical protein